MAKFKTSFLDYIKTHNLTGIKAGNTRENFLNIWMVVVQDRVFARSWGFAERSWFHSFSQGAEGAILAGASIVAVRGVLPEDLKELTNSINQAYLDKYDTGGDNSFYAKGIIEPEHIKFTMEFIPLNQL
ncbi:DUF2255 domain-containing protein [Pedobacter sp. HMWF019]|uniref:DUF2255 family protein n=1 Tax=Pedobacter sp. HMWF019 TaxID=2056856 RepID=UPI000D3871DC|nr:DUF2255 family protein [Pedobacter sp. HMWF019]PTT02295.1 DUF2255 domain-containing protein [Pedobacter sp. HMWF019]